MLAFARALGEYGSLILISGNIPLDTEVSSVFIRSQIESGNVPGAAAVSVVLLSLSVLMLILVSLFARSGPRGEKGILARTVSRVIGRSQVGAGA
jgi:sulfate transport system permease protein